MADRAKRRRVTSEEIVNSFMNDSDSDDDRFDLGQESQSSDEEFLNNSEWEYETDEEQMPSTSSSTVDHGESFACRLPNLRMPAA